MKRTLIGAALVLIVTGLARAEDAPAVPLPPGMTRIFDGKSLDGWVQEPINATTFSGGDITNLAGLVKKLGDKPDAAGKFVAAQLDEETQKAIAAFDGSPDASKKLRSLLARSLSKIVTGESIYDETRFGGVKMREEAQTLRTSNPTGRDLARLNRVLLEDAFPDELAKTPAVAWVVREGVLASTGAGRGVIYTTKSFGRYRVIFDVRHVSGNPDHRAGVLVFCTAPKENEKPLDALGSIQFQVPNGGSWDYRAGKNNGGKGLFERVVTPKFDEHQWSRVEILVDPASGTARMAVAQPVGAKGVEVLKFKDQTAGKAGPFALQMHNRGLLDEYANIAVVENPGSDELIMTK